MNLQLFLQTKKPLPFSVKWQGQRIPLFLYLLLLQLLSLSFLERFREVGRIVDKALVREAVMRL